MEHFHSDWTFKLITMLHINAPSEKLYICAVCACQKKIYSDLKLVTYKRAHQPDHFI